MVEIRFHSALIKVRHDLNCHTLHLSPPAVSLTVTTIDAAISAAEPAFSFAHLMATSWLTCLESRGRTRVREIVSGPSLSTGLRDDVNICV